MRSWRIKLALALLLLAAPAAAQTVTPQSFGLNVKYPATTTVKVFAGTCRLWDAGVVGPASDVSWAAVETASGVYSWTTFDAQVAQCVARGQQIIYTFGNVPGWANGSAAKYVPPTSFSTLYAFQQAVVSRYAGDGIVYDCWNEANGATSWWGGTQAQMLSVCSNLYSVVHATDPTASVATPTVTGGSQFSWMQGYLASGGSAYVDVTDVHCYPIQAPAYSTTPAITTPEAMIYLAQQFQETFALNGLSSKPFACDEGSWATDSVSALTATQKQAYAAIWQVIFASAGLKSWSWYEYDDNLYGVLWDGASWLNTAGQAYRAAQSWLAGATFTSALARIAGTNEIRNPTGTGYVAGTPGTPPTDWSVSNPDLSHGITTSIVGSCAAGAGVELLTSGTATAGASGFVQLQFESSTQIAASLGQQWTAGYDVQLMAGAVVPSDGVIALGINEYNSSGTYLDRALYLPISPITATPLSANAQAFSAPTANASVAYIAPTLTVTYSVGDTVSIPLCVGNAFADTGSEYAASITDAGGNADQIVWDSAGGPTTFTTAYAYAYDLFGAQHALSGTATLTNLPVLLTNAVRKGWTP